MKMGQITVHNHEVPTGELTMNVKLLSRIESALNA